MTAILIANRGEIAIRIARAARDLGLEVIGVHATDDAASLHVSYMDVSHVLPGSGPAAYLDQRAVLDAARESGATLIHPGYGFLSENAGFARACAEEGLRFVGPSPEALDLFGDKIAARRLAQAAGVPVLPGTDRATSLEEARAFAARHGAVMIKALAGGGGRGMRIVTEAEGLDAAYASCRNEALTAFGIGDLYVEKLLPAARHIEVQVLGDGQAVTHLWERDCSVQRRHQKMIEIAPAPALAPGLRTELLVAAVALARATGHGAGYNGLATMEFLVHADGFWFMEANPRLQVEHTVTEEVTGVDLVQSQIRLAQGATLAELGLLTPPEPRGFAIEARVGLEAMGPDGNPVPSAGTLSAYAPPGGPNLRVDSYGYAGYSTSLRYDSLLAKVIARGSDFPRAAANAKTALGEFLIAGVSTNLPFLRAILAHPAFLAGGFDTTLVPAHLDALMAAAAADRPREAPLAGSETRAEAPTLPLAPGDIALDAPLSGTLMSIDVAIGTAVAKGQPLMVLEAMKMEHVVRAPASGRVSGLGAAAGATILEGMCLATLTPGDVAADAGAAPEAMEDWSAEVAAIQHRRDAALAMGGPAKLTRQAEAGKLDARARIEALLDPGSFSEIGALTGFGDYDEDGNLTGFLPANFIAGTGRIDGRKLVIGSDDFTVRAGSGDAAIHAKQVFSEDYAREMRLPVVRLLDGASGGGSVKIAQELGYHYLPVNPGWDAVVDNMSLVPVMAACLGPTVGLGAARLVMSHFAVMVEGIGQVFTAGPPIVAGATREKLTKDELGGAGVHRANGIVERIVETEAEAFALIRRVLGYLPRSVHHLPPVGASAEPDAAATEALIGAIPRGERQPYAIDPILEAIFDAGSITRYADYGGSTVTALARLAGHPVGVITTDPAKGATMSAEGAHAVTRLVDLCETFHLPIVSLTDQAGMSIGRAAEERGTIRHGARAIAAIYQARVPQAELILRRVFGVGGAGAVNRHRAQRSWSWPSGSWGSLPPQGGIEAAFRAVLDRAPDREAAIARIAQQLEQIGSPLRTAEKFGVQDVIDPRESRALLIDWIEDAWAKLPELLGPPALGLRP